MPFYGKGATFALGADGRFADEPEADESDVTAAPASLGRPKAVVGGPHRSAYALRRLGAARCLAGAAADGDVRR